MSTIKLLSDLLIYSMSNKTGKGQVSLGKVSTSLSNAAAERDLDISGLEIIVDSYGIRHSFKKHGVKSVNAKNGEIPICVFDILLLPELLAECTVNSIDQDCFRLNKSKFGLIGEIVCELRISKRKGNRIYLKTIYNKKRAVSSP